MVETRWSLQKLFFSVGGLTVFLLAGVFVFFNIFPPASQQPEIFFAEDVPLSSVCRGGRYDLCSQAPKCGEYKNKSFDWFAENLSGEGPGKLHDPEVHAYCGGSNLYCKGYVPFCCYEMVRLNDPDMCQGYDTLSCLPTQCAQVSDSERKNCGYGLKAYCPKAHGLDPTNVQPIPLSERFPNDVIFLRLDKAGESERTQVQTKRPEIWQLYLKYIASSGNKTPTPQSTPIVSPTTSPPASQNSPTPPPIHATITPSDLPAPPEGCFYENAQCIQAPCNPILVCPTKTPTPNLEGTIVPQPTGIAEISISPLLPLICKVASVDYIFSIDTSRSMNNKLANGRTKLDQAKRAAKRLAEDITTYAASNSAVAKIGVVSFSERTKMHAELTEDLQSVLDAIDTLAITQRGTCIECGIRRANNKLNEWKTDEITTQAVVLFSDGRTSHAIDVKTKTAKESGDRSLARKKALAAAERGRRKNITYYVAGFGVKTDENVSLNETLLKKIANDPNKAFYQFNPGNRQAWQGPLESILQFRCPESAIPMTFLVSPKEEEMGIFSLLWQKLASLIPGFPPARE